MRGAVTQHIISVAGQVAAALPPVVVMIYLSRAGGLEQAGMFAIVVGVSAAAFSTAHWGLRTSLLLDRFETADLRSYRVARLFALCLAAILVAAIAGFSDIDFRLVAGLILYKACDGMVDLEFAANQVLVDTRAAINAYASQQVIKLLLAIAATIVAALYPPVSIATAFLVSGVAALCLIAYKIYRQPLAESAPWPSPGSIRRVFAKATWFAVAVAACAVLTSAPRFSLGWLYEGDLLGVVGVTLSVSTFFGMVFHTAWSRHLPEFDGKRRFQPAATRFLTETTLIAALLAVISAYVLPAIVSLVFAFAEPDQLQVVRRVLLASVLFFMAMSSCNLYKVTNVPWIETASYAVALLVAGTVAVAVPAMREMHILLTITGMVMLILGLTAFRAPRQVLAAGIRR